MKTLVTLIVIVGVVGLLGMLLNTVRDGSGTATSTNSISNDLSTDGGLEVTVAEVVYFGTTTGFLARPNDKKAYPGVVMIHEWWGLNQNIKDMAEELASQGYAVLAVDLYNGRVAATSTEARELTSSLNQAQALENLKAAKAYLTAQGSEKIASLGWCFGGGQSLRLSTSGEPLDATVIYYGQLSTSTVELANIKWPVLGIFGETDTSIPTTTVRAFDSALDSLGIENEIVIYPGVGHAFANPSGMNYAPEPTRDAWQKTLAFLSANLQ